MTHFILPYKLTLSAVIPFGTFAFHSCCRDFTFTPALLLQNFAFGDIQRVSEQVNQVNGFKENLQCCSQSQLYMMINYIITEDNLFKQCSVLNCFLFPFFVSLFLPLIITHRHTVLPVRADSLYMMQLNTQAYKNNWRSVIMLLLLY